MSCLKQTYENFEILIIDNASTDDTRKIIETITDKRIFYLYTDKKGRSNARNIGITRSQNEYLLFLDADDEIDSNLLMSAKNILKNTNYSGYYFGTRYINSKNKKQTVRKPEKNWKRLLKVYNTFPINSVIIPNSVIKYFNEDFDYNEDWLFWYENLKNIDLYIDTKYVGAIVNIHGENTMSNVKNMTENEMLVRSIIKKDLKYTDKVKNIIFYFKFMCFYLLLLDRDKDIEEQIKQNFLCIYNILYLLLKIPVIRLTIANILENKKTSNPIQY